MDDSRHGVIRTCAARGRVVAYVLRTQAVKRAMQVRLPHKLSKAKHRWIQTATSTQSGCICITRTSNHPLPPLQKKKIPPFFKRLVRSRRYLRSSPRAVSSLRRCVCRTAVDALVILCSVCSRAQNGLVLLCFI